MLSRPSLTSRNIKVVAVLSAALWCGCSLAIDFDALEGCPGDLVVLDPTKGSCGCPEPAILSAFEDVCICPDALDFRDGRCVCDAPRMLVTTVDDAGQTSTLCSCPTELGTEGGAFAVPGEDAVHCQGQLERIGVIGDPTTDTIRVAILPRGEERFAVALLQRSSFLTLSLVDVDTSTATPTLQSSGGKAVLDLPLDENGREPVVDLELVELNGQLLPILITGSGALYWADFSNPDAPEFKPLPEPTPREGATPTANSWLLIEPNITARWQDDARTRATLIFSASQLTEPSGFAFASIAGFGELSFDGSELTMRYDTQLFPGVPPGSESSLGLITLLSLDAIAGNDTTFLASGYQVVYDFYDFHPSCSQADGRACLNWRDVRPVLYELEYAPEISTLAPPIKGNLAASAAGLEVATELAESNFAELYTGAGARSTDNFGFWNLGSAGAARDAVSIGIPIFFGCQRGDQLVDCDPSLETERFELTWPGFFPTALTLWSRSAGALQANDTLTLSFPLAALSAVGNDVVGAPPEARLFLGLAYDPFSAEASLILFDASEGEPEELFTYAIPETAAIVTSLPRFYVEDRLVLIPTSSGVTVLELTTRGP